DAEGVLVARGDGGEPLATVRLERRDFESAHFGIPIARIEAPAAVAADEVRLPALRALYGDAWSVLRAAGYRHACALSSARDRAAWWALQERGAFHVGTKISWMQALEGRRDGEVVTPPLRLELLERARIPSLSHASWRRLHEWSGSGFDRGPFVFDLGVPPA